MADTSVAAPNTSTFQAGDTASGVAARLGMTPAQFLSYNPDLAAKGALVNGQNKDYQGLTGLINIGQAYNTGPTKSAVAVSSVPSRLNTVTNTSALNSALNSLPTAPPAPADTGTDPIISQLTTLHANSDAATKSLLASTMASYQNQMNSVNKSYENYKAGLEVLGIEHNAAKGTPELLAGQIQSVANEQAGKISTIQANMQKALINAKNASENNDFKTLNAEMARYKELQTEKQDAIKNMYDSITSAKTASADEIALYHSTLQGLSPNAGPNGEKSEQEQFLEALAKRDNLPLDGLISALATFSQTDQGKQLTLAQKEKNLSKTSSKTSGTTANAISKFTDLMESIKGIEYDSKGKATGKKTGDSFVDPYQWINARTEWQKAGKSLATFNSNFKQYLNPLSYGLAGFKTSKSSSGSSGRSTTG